MYSFWMSPCVAKVPAVACMDQNDIDPLAGDIPFALLS